MYTPNVRNDSEGSMRGTFVVEVEEPEVNDMVPGAFNEVASVGLPSFHTQAIKYQKLFCIFIAPPVEKSNRSQCCATIIKVSIVVALSCMSLCFMEARGARSYRDVTLKEESSTKAAPSVWTTTPIQAEVNIAVDKSGSKESTIKQKHRSQKIGPLVEPWPGPKSGRFGVLE